MGKVRSILIYLWALLALPIVLATFIGNGYWAKKLITVTGLKISPWDTGGEIVHKIDHDQFHTIIHRPVFDGLLAERRKGFVQVDWWAVVGDLPEIIAEEIDYDQDGTADFRIRFDTVRNQVELDALSPHVIGLRNIYRLKDWRAVRVSLKNNRK